MAALSREVYVTFRSIGSLWGQWDLHFHTPSSFDYADKSITNEQIVHGLVDAGIVAVAITDHHVIDPKRIKALRSLGGGRLTVFPGIELRTELGGKESVHLIGIFPETADVDHIWTKLQGPLDITPVEAAKKGDDHVYVHFMKAATLIRELGGVVSAHVGSKSNSIENIANNHPYKQAFKEDLARDHIDLFELGQVKDQIAYNEKVFPTIGYERPLVICSDNHDIRDYKLKVPCWIKGDPAFATFQQVRSDPKERVYIGDLPLLLDRVRKNPTKYLRSIGFKKISGSTLSEDWFSGDVPLNPGLIAVIGNKGTGKTALAESIGLLGNTAQSSEFSFLHPAKFRQPRNNKAKHFLAELVWVDGHKTSKSLDSLVEEDAVELVGYIPQHYLETICNEIQSSDNRFDKELKSVIFSHVKEADRLGAETLDELLETLTEQTQVRMDQLRDELRGINKRIVELERQGSKEAKQLLLNLYSEKNRELTVHRNSKPPEVRKPEADPGKQREMQAVAKQIEERQKRRIELSSGLREIDSRNKDAAMERALVDRMLGRIRNFEMQYDTLIAESDADCKQLSLDLRELVKVHIERSPLTKLREDAQQAIDAAHLAKEQNETTTTTLKNEIDNLTAQLDAPNLAYQKYVQDLQDWQLREQEIIGSENESGSLTFIEKELRDYGDIPASLKRAEAEREAKTREIYAELQQLVSTYQSLYSPVQKFIEEHKLSAGKFNFQFQAAITAPEFPELLLNNVNQTRRGSFSGGDEGRKQANRLVATADFQSADGAIAFVAAVIDHLRHDRRHPSAPTVAISDQLKKGYNEEDLLDFLFSLKYLKPRYTIRWFGKEIEELSPGERGTLLLVFYLLIDRRDVPLIIDQPEDNLDNETVVDLLVPCISEARKRRQVIIVTHNPNLAVVCDADQVIHCHIDKSARNKVTYTSGSLENPINNKLTVDVLEGMRPAFDHRDSKYQAEAP